MQVSLHLVVNFIFNVSYFIEKAVYCMRIYYRGRIFNELNYSY